MKKNLIALAVFGAFSSAALAQSNVTLYGIVDVGYQYNDPNNNGPVNQSSTSGIVSGYQSGSRFGVRGSEALSSSLNAVFTLEAGFDASTGTSSQGGRLFGRQAFAGLSGNWGTVVAGRLATFSSGTGSFDMFGVIDPFATGWGDASLGSTFMPSGALRLDNAALYQSPTWGGFKFGAGYSFGTSGAEVPGSGNNIRATFFGASWAGGPFYVALTWDLLDAPSPGSPGSAAPAATGGIPALFPNDSEQKVLQVGATWDLKFVKLALAYGTDDNAFYNTGGGSQPTISPLAGEDADSWMAGVTIPLFGGSLLASYQKRDGDVINVCLGAVTAANTCAVASTARQGQIDVWAVGYAYPFSRRTNLYVAASDRDGKKFYSGFPVIDRSQYTIGVRHLF